MTSQRMKVFWGFSLLFVCLTIGFATWSVPAAAQDGKSATGDKASIHSVDPKGFQFEVVSIKPVKVSSYGGSLQDNTNPSTDGFRSRLRISKMILMAYADTGGVDAWIYTPLLNLPPESDEWFDVDARVAENDLSAWQHQSGQHELLRSAMQSILKERFNLALHERPTELPDYKLIVGKRGPKLKPTPLDFVLPSGGRLESGGALVPERVGDKAMVHFYGATMKDLASFESRFANRPVHDVTGLSGRYNFTFQPTETSSSGGVEEATKFPVSDLGLELKPGHYSGITLVIDHIEKLSQN